MNPRITATAATDLTPDQRWCTCCERPLKGMFAWLELDQRTNTYHDRGGVPPDNSQGWFPFGLTCARKKLRESACLEDGNQNTLLSAPNAAGAGDGRA